MVVRAERRAGLRPRDSNVVVTCGLSNANAHAETHASGPGPGLETGVAPRDLATNGEKDGGSTGGPGQDPHALERPDIALCDAANIGSDCGAGKALAQVLVDDGDGPSVRVQE